MADKIEFPEDIDKWFKGKIKEGVGTGHEHCDDFYRFKDYGIEHDSDGSWEAYTIIDEKPILAKKGLGSFGEAVEYFKHELSKKELADADDCEIEEEHPDAPSFPEQESGGMKLEIFLKSAEEMLGEYEHFQKIDYRNNLTLADKPAAIKTQKFITAMNEGKPVDRSGVAAVTNGAYITGNPNSGRTYAGAVTLKGMGEDYGAWPQFLNSKLSRIMSKADELYPLDGNYYYGDDVGNLPLDELSIRAFQLMNPNKADIDKREKTNDARRAPYMSGLMPKLDEKGRYTGKAINPYSIAKGKDKAILKHKDTGADLHTFRPAQVLYRAPNSAKIVNRAAKPQEESHDAVSAKMDDEEYYNNYRSPEKWINDRETALNTLLGVPKFRNALREYDRLRKDYIAARNYAREKNPDKNLAPPKKLSDAYEYMQGVADKWLKRYVGGRTYVDIINGNNTITRGDKEYTVPIWYLPPHLEDISYRMMEEVPDRNDSSKKVWANGDYRYMPDAVEWRDNRNYDLDIPDELYEDDPKYFASNYPYPYQINQPGMGTVDQGTGSNSQMTLNNFGKKDKLETGNEDIKDKGTFSKNSIEPVSKSASEIMQEWSDSGTHLIREPWKVLALDAGSKESDPLTFRDDTGKILFDLRHI